MSEYKSVWVRTGRQKKEEKKLLGRGVKLVDDPHQADIADLSAQVEMAGPISIRPKRVLLNRSSACTGRASRAQTAGSM